MIPHKTPPSLSQASNVTLKAKKKAINFPLRKYAIKA